MFFFCLHHKLCVKPERFYIVISPDSYCPQEFTGEPCLTLQQYASNRRQLSNAVLTLESGNHLLQDSGLTFNSDNTVENFTMTSKNASITWSRTGTTSFFQIMYTYYSQNVYITNITFTGNGGYFRVSWVQEVVIEYCDFWGVSLSFHMITNFTISRICFSDYYNHNR